MARDVEADVKVNDKTKPGLDSVERNFKSTGDKISKESDRFGKKTGDSIIRGLASISPGLAKTVADGMGTGAKLGGPLLISGIVSALPVLSGLIGAAVTGGAAGAGILGGVALAARDERVKAAGAALASNLLSDLGTKADVFIAPVLNVIDTIGERFQENGDTIESIFANSAKFLEPLADSVLDFTSSILEGIDIAVGRAGPVMEALGTGIETLGTEVRGFFDNLSSNSEANAAVLEETFNAAAGAVNLLGTSLTAVSYVFAQFDKVMPLSLLGQLVGLFEDTDDKAEEATTGLHANASGMQVLSDATEVAGKDFQLFNKALQDNAAAAKAADEAQRSLFDDLTSVGAAMDGATTSAKKNGRTLSENTEKGRNNRTALSNLASAFNTYRTNLEKSGRSATEVNGVMATQRNRLISAATAMGATKAEARRLADSLLGIKPRAVSVKVNGSAAAASNARNVRQEIEQVRSKSVTVTVRVNDTQLDAVERRLARAGGANAAAGDSFGQNAAGQLSRVGGAAAVNATVTSNLYLDGRLVHSYTDQQIAASRSREKFRSKVGRRT